MEAGRGAHMRNRKNIRPPSRVNGRQPTGERLTMKEIENRFKSEWVLLENPVTTKMLEIKSGTVLAHCKDRDELYRRAAVLRLRHSAILFTGPLPKGIAYAL